MAEPCYNVLFLCTANSARSILAEAILNSLGQGRFKAFSAGSFPSGKVNPHAAAVVEMLGFPADQFRSKSWDIFAAPGAPEMDFVFTVCDDAAGEVCPLWPGQPVTAHWGVPDPAKVTHSEAETSAAFAETARQLRHRLEAFAALPLAAIDRMALHHHLSEIHRIAEQPTG